MNVYPVPDTLAGAYKGAGYALAAIKSGELVDIIYLKDLLPDFNPADVGRAISDRRPAPSIRHLAALGDVSVGMCSCWEFCEL